MADKLWKSFERWVGKHIFEGAKRNIGSGSINSTDDNSPRYGDVIHPLYCVECKCRKTIAIFRWWDKVKEEAKKSGKIPVLVMREVGDVQDTLVTLNWQDFVKMRRCAEAHGVLSDSTTGG